MSENTFQLHTKTYQMFLPKNVWPKRLKHKLRKKIKLLSLFANTIEAVMSNLLSHPRPCTHTTATKITATKAGIVPCGHTPCKKNRKGLESCQHRSRSSGIHCLIALNLRFASIQFFSAVRELYDFTHVHY